MQLVAAQCPRAEAWAQIRTMFVLQVLPYYPIGQDRNLLTDDLLLQVPQ